MVVLWSRGARRFLLVVSGAMLLTSHAEALTPLSFYASAGGYSSTTSGPVTYAAALCPTGPACGSFSASAETSGASGGLVHATLTMTGVPLALAGVNGINTYSSADVNYGIMLAGTAGVTVPVYISSFLSALPVSGYLSNQATLTVKGVNNGGPSYSKTCYNGYCSDSAPPDAGGTVTGSGSSGPAYLLSGQEYIVHLSATAYAGYNGTADAFADPTFTIDPAFASQFQLLGVPGVVPSAVPEPANWLLMLVGFGTMGGVLRARKRMVSAAA